MAERRLKEWLRAYLAYTAESESPEEFHKWVALSAIAGAVRRKVFFNMSYFHLYPNMYIVLVAPAGKCKKSTSMRISRQIMGQVPGLSYTTDSVTRERLIMDLSQSFNDGHSSMTAFSTEFASLLTSSGMDMVVFLTDIFDSPTEWAHRTKTGGTNLIKAPYLNLLGATTPDWIAKAMPLDTVGIGLTSRIVFVYAENPRVRPAFPKLSPEQQALEALLAEDLTTMSNLSGEYFFEPDAAEMYDEWYRGRIENPNPSNDPRLNGYYERKPIHLIKVCMLVAASFRDELIMTIEDLKLAMGLFDEIESRMPKVFSNVGKNPLSADVDDILMAIIQSGDNGVYRGELIKRFKHSVDMMQVDTILSSLTATRQVVMIPGGYFKARRD